MPSVLKLMQYVLPKSILRMNLAAAYADPATLTHTMVARYHDLMRAPGVRAAVMRRRSGTGSCNTVCIIRAIRAPTLLLWGDKGAMIPVANAQDYVRALPVSTLANLEGLGHVPQEESPKRSLAPVLDFLRN